MLVTSRAWSTSAWTRTVSLASWLERLVEYFAGAIHGSVVATASGPWGFSKAFILGSTTADRPRRPAVKGTPQVWRRDWHLSSVSGEKSPWNLGSTTGRSKVSF